jgi:hypothetical protein
MGDGVRVVGNCPQEDSRPPILLARHANQEANIMTMIRVKESTRQKLQRLAVRLLGTPGVEPAKHSGQQFVPADQVIRRALEALETSLEQPARRPSP